MVITVKIPVNKIISMLPNILDAHYTRTRAHCLQGNSSSESPEGLYQGRAWAIDRVG
jgi:hypothetical protein